MTIISSLGEKLRAMRSALDLTQIDVEFLSREIADREACPDFIVRNAQLSSIEHGHSLPGPGKLLALAEIYGLNIEQVMRSWATIKRPWWT
jgi:transcriptional regulator with XRE-family HTH domain